jgi:hypothetical protein
MSTPKEKKYVPVFTVHWTRNDDVAPPPWSVRCKGGVTEALLWFHLERQLVDGLAPELYSVQEVTSDHASPQRWKRDELPASNLLSKAVLTKPMARKYEAALQEFIARGGYYTVAGA